MGTRTHANMGCGGSSADKEQPKDAGKLHYFTKIRSRGESVRMVARASDLKLVEDPIDMMNDWESIKPTLPEGKQYVPYITKPDGSKLWEVVDILKHLAELGGVLVVDAIQEEWAKKANDMPWLAVDL